VVRSWATGRDRQRITGPGRSQPTFHAFDSDSGKVALGGYSVDGKQDVARLPVKANPPLAWPR
jgi:hypothetical protein